MRSAVHCLAHKTLDKSAKNSAVVGKVGARCVRPSAEMKSAGMNIIGVFYAQKPGMYSDPVIALLVANVRIRYDRTSRAF